MGKVGEPKGLGPFSSYYHPSDSLSYFQVSGFPCIPKISLLRLSPLISPLISPASVTNPSRVNPEPVSKPIPRRLFSIKKGMCSFVVLDLLPPHDGFFDFSCEDLFGRLESFYRCSWSYLVS